MTARPALLRPPPFPGLKAEGDPQPPLAAENLDQTGCTKLLDAIRLARVGGAFWGNPADVALPGAPEAIDVLVRAGSNAELAGMPGTPASHPGEGKLMLDPEQAAGTIDPWDILSRTAQLMAHGDDEWIAIAAALGIEIKILSSGSFGEPADSPEMLLQKAAHAFQTPMRDLYSAAWLSPFEAIEQLAEWRRIIDANRGDAGERIVAACGISWWKRDEIRRFLWSPGKPLQIHKGAARALKTAKSEGGVLAVWPSRISSRLINDAERAGVPLVRVEDGFVRSVGLGSNLVPPLSVIVDRRGIHFDPGVESDLERILNTAEFPYELTERAARLRGTIVASGISKYASSPSVDLPAANSVNDGRVVLVTGQVEDDMSVLAGGGGLTSNLELLRRTRALEPDAEIWWRPHPDVDAGHRNGFVADDAALEYADKIVRSGSMAELLGKVDALHVLTSLSGFEALLRGLDVTCHGTPFYAGWGLTRDLGTVPERRHRRLTLDQLVAGVLLLYPRYLDPVTGLPCPPEVLIQRMASNAVPNRLGWVGPIRKVQGQMMAWLRRKAGQ